MKNISSLLILSLLGVTAVSAQEALPVYLDEQAPIESRVADALSRMTLAEKCRLAYAQSKFSSPGVPRLGIPEMRYSDGPHGVRSEFNWDNWDYAGWTNDSITAFPALTCLAATWNPELAYAYGLNVGEEARYRQKTVLLGPGVNIYRTPLNGRNFEYMGEDPLLASRMCVPYIKGLQLNGVGACIKHYILNDQEEFRGHVDVKVSERAFYEIYLPPFKAAIHEGGAWSLMGSYNRYHGQHVSHNEVLLTQRLKGELGFTGMVVSDWGATHDTREAAMFGLDSEMGSYTNGLNSQGTFGYEDYYLGRAYYDLCHKGEIPDSVINDKAGRVLAVLLKSQHSDNRLAPTGRVNCPEHLVVARQVAEEGIVLLKNDPVAKGESPLLPLDLSRYSHILVVGENASRSLCMGGGSSELKARHEVSPLEGLLERYGASHIQYAMGYVSGGAHFGAIDAISPATYDSLRNDAVEKARKADLVLYVGGLNKNHFSDCEGGDRLTYDLDFHQNELIEALLDVNPRMVCVLISGNAIHMPWISRIPALVQDWYLGSEAGHALASVLSGDVCPSGKTVFSYPLHLEDCPAHQLGRVSYPGCQPSEMPAEYQFGKTENPSSAALLAVAAKANGLRNKARTFASDLLVRNDSNNPRTHRGNDNEVEVYAEDILVGYRWYDFFDRKAKSGVARRGTLFPFGYGLSYTTFEYGKPVIEGNTVTVTVRNTGKVTGKEVVQFYVGDDKASVVRPVKELKHFAKVELQPGETQTVQYQIQDQDLKFFDENRHEWTLEPGSFTIYVCASSADIRGTVKYVR